MRLLLQEPSIILYFVLGALCLLSIGVFVYKKQKGSAEYQINALLKPHIVDEIKEIIIPDGVGGLLEIEHLILTKKGLLLVQTYPMSGNLFGADNIDQWTQIIDGRSYKFANPLRHIRTSSQAIKALTPKIPIFCRIIFSANSVFPKGKPDEVSVLTTLSEDMTIIDGSASVAVEAKQAWDKIMRIARKNSQAVQREGES